MTDREQQKLWKSLQADGWRVTAHYMTLSDKFYKLHYPKAFMTDVPETFDSMQKAIQFAESRRWG